MLLSITQIHGGKRLVWKAEARSTEEKKLDKTSFCREKKKLRLLQIFLEKILSSRNKNKMIFKRKLQMSKSTWKIFRNEKP